MHYRPSAQGRPAAQDLLGLERLTDICRKPAILDLRRRARSVLTSLVWGANFFLKEPRSDAYVSWHQDATYWGLEPADIVTAWVAFTPSTVESGCMRVVPGTHQLAIVEHRETWEADNLLSRGQEIAVEVDVEKVVDVVLAPGEMSLHHVKIAHNSEPNRSAQRRIGFAIRYVAAHVKQAGRRRDKAMLVARHRQLGTTSITKKARAANSFRRTSNVMRSPGCFAPCPAKPAKAS